MRLRDLVNLGEVSEGWLVEVGVADAEALAEVGSAEAYRRVVERFPDQRISLNLLYALEGALLDERWDRLPVEWRRSLRAEVGR